MTKTSLVTPNDRLVELMQELWMECQKLPGKNRHISIGYDENMHAIIVRAHWTDDRKKEPLHTFRHAFLVDQIKFERDLPSVAVLLDRARTEQMGKASVQK